MLPFRHRSFIASVSVACLAAGCGSQPFAAIDTPASHDLTAVKVADYTGSDALSAKADAVTDETTTVSLPAELTQNTAGEVVIALTLADIVVTFDSDAAGRTNPTANGRSARASVGFRLAELQENACVSEFSVGPFELTITDGTVSIEPTELPIPTEALALLHGAEFDSAGTAHLGNHPVQLAREIKSEGLIGRCAKHPDGERVLRALDASWPAMESQTLIHTDYWPGNTVWSRGRLTGIVDWEMPALGEPAYDVAYCRQDLTMLFGLDAADRFRARYEDISGIRIETPHFWDLMVASRAMPDPAAWLPGYHDLGRTDITKRMMRRRFREFISRALAAT
ncbi:MAG: aminoglycoside phosphotransferase family protein [Chloroflexi bacterium]|nr:aminoglycoside phosphotransferase family protein [Chloroflexota bacterium]